MLNEQNKRLTLKDLMAKQEQLANKKKKSLNLFVKSLEGVITIEQPDTVTIIDASKIDEGFESDKYLVYNCIVEPNLKDKDLLKAYGCVEPTEILKIFDDGEISSIARECMNLAGYNSSVRVVEEIKN